MRDEVLNNLITDEDGIFWNLCFIIKYADTLDVSDQVILDVVSILIQLYLLACFGMKHAIVIVRQVLELLCDAFAESVLRYEEVHSLGF